jgi:hypothetical protein
MMRAVHGGSLDLSKRAREPIRWGRSRQAALRSDRTRAIIAVADIDTNPEDYPVEVIHEPFDHDLRDDDRVFELVTSIAQISGRTRVPLDH